MPKKNPNQRRRSRGRSGGSSSGRVSSNQGQTGKSSRGVRAQEDSVPPLAKTKLTVSGILAQPKLLDFFEGHQLVALLFQIVFLSVVIAGLGTLIVQFIPDLSPSGATNGIYVAGVVFLLLIETVHQWLLRSATLPMESGLQSLAGTRFPTTDPREFRSYLDRTRDSNEARLGRLFEPFQRVGLVAGGLAIHFLAQKAGGDSSPPSWAEVLSRDWVMTLLFGFGGFLWQLKNPDNIWKLLVGLRIQRHVMAFGEYFWVIALVVSTLGSLVALSWFLFPWGLIILGIVLAVLMIVARRAFR